MEPPVPLSLRPFLVPVLLAAAALASACSGLPSAGDRRTDGPTAGSPRSGVEAFGTIDAGVSRYEQKK